MKMNKICPEFRAAMLRHSGFIDYEGDRWQGCIGSDCAKWHRVYWGGARPRRMSSPSVATVSTTPMLMPGKTPPSGLSN